MNRSKPSRWSFRKLAGYLLCSGVTLGIAVVFLHRAPAVKEPAQPFLSSDPESVALPFWNYSPAHVYPYSVVPGGVADRGSLQSAIASDPVVAVHYSDVDLASVHVIQLEAPQLAYVSYRRGGKIFWTRHKMRIPAGESLLSDGSHLARTRCGNRISEIPRTPTSSSEPPANAFEDPVPKQPPVIYEPASSFTSELYTNEAETPIPPPDGFLPPADGDPSLPIVDVPSIPPPFDPPIAGRPHTPPLTPPPLVPTPEPATFVLLLAGASSAVFLCRRRADRRRSRSF